MMTCSNVALPEGNGRQDKYIPANLTLSQFFAVLKSDITKLLFESIGFIISLI